jgi:hypothetical protein
VAHSHEKDVMNAFAALDHFGASVRTTPYRWNKRFCSCSSFVLTSTRHKRKRDSRATVRYR